MPSFTSETTLGYLFSPIAWLFVSCTITALVILTLLPFILFHDDIQQLDDYNWSKKKRRDLLLSDPILLRDTKESTEKTKDSASDDSALKSDCDSIDTCTAVSAPMLQSLFHRLVVQNKWREAGYVADHVYKLVRAKLLLTNLGVDGLRLLEDVIRGYPPGVENHVTAVFHTLADVIIGKYPGSAEEPASSRGILGRWCMQVMTSLITHVATVSRSDIVRMLCKRYFQDHVASLQIWTFKSVSVFLVHCLKTRHNLKTPENESIQLLLREGMTSRNKLVTKAAQDCLTHYTLVDSEAGDKLRYQIGANL
jgi:hypothetical protein